MAISVGGVGVGHLQGFQLLQITVGVNIGGGRPLAGSIVELVQGKEGLEQNILHPQQGGSGTAGAQGVFKGCGSGGTALWSGDLGGHHPPGQGPVGFQTQVARQFT